MCQNENVHTLPPIPMHACGSVEYVCCSELLMSEELVNMLLEPEDDEREEEEDTGVDFESLTYMLYDDDDGDYD